ncbi:hypothetical protein Tco_0397616 [Tanacetum coccineum]
MASDHNSLELGIHDHSNEPSSSKLVPKVVPPADKTATSQQELELLFHHHITMLRLVLTEPEVNPTKSGRMTKPYSSTSSNLKTKTSANFGIQDLPLRYQDYQDKYCQGRLLASFLDDVKYEHVGQDTRSQGGKDLKEKDLKILDQKTKSKDRKA